MTTTNAVSVEQLAINNTSHLGVEVLGVVESLRTKYEGTDKPVTNGDLESLAKVIKASTNIDMSVMVVPGEFAAAVLVDDVIGHSGVSGDLQELGILSGKHTQYQDRYLKGTIDLKNVKVGGEFTSIKFNMILGDRLITNPRFTVEEVTSFILHETGHAFWSLATIGEYVWLNYFLSEGIEVLLNKKSNKYRVEVLDIGYLEKHVTDDELRKSLRQQPTEGHLRKAILDVEYNHARGHFHSVSNPGSFKRHEQMADWFVARLGYSRPLATMLHKLQRMSPMGARYYTTKKQFIALEAAKMLWGVTGLVTGVVTGYGYFLLAGYLVKELIDNVDYGEYDNPTERIRKLRLDMVAQLKDVLTSPVKKETLLEDIKVVDGLLKDMNQLMPLLTMLSHVMRPGFRRKNQLLKQEQTLESLLNNDLFIFANKFR